MIRAISVGLLAGGLALGVYGINASHSFNSDVSRFFTGNPTDHAMWLIVGGVAMVLTGAAGLFTAASRTRAAR